MNLSTLNRLCLFLFVAMTGNTLLNAAPVNGNGLETEATVPATVQTAYNQAVDSNSIAPVQSILSSVPTTERTSIILGLLSQEVSHAKMRGEIARLLFQQPINADGVQRRHLLILTRAYQVIANNPLQPEQPGGRGSLDDSIIQLKIIDELASLLNVRSEAATIVYSGHTSKDWLNQLFNIALKMSNDTNTSSQIQACQSLP